MSNNYKSYRFNILSAATSSAEYQITSSQLKAPPVLGGQRIRPLEGRAESIPTQIKVLDNDDYFTAKIADSGGRAVLMNRQAQVQTQVGSSTGAWNTRYTGRITSIQDQVGYYDVTLLDEQHVMRNTDIFTKLEWPSSSNAHSTAAYAMARLHPPGIYGDFMNVNVPTQNFPYLISADVVSYGEVITVKPLGVLSGVPSNVSYVSDAAYNILKGDIKDEIDADGSHEMPFSSTTGNFKTLRVTLNGSEHEVHSLTAGKPAGGQPQRKILAEYEKAMELVQDADKRDQGLVAGFWSLNAIASSSEFSTPTRRGSYYGNMEVQLIMPGHEPTDAMPLHVGGNNGVHPFQLLQDIYDEVGATYSSSAMAALIDDPWYDVGFWRIPKRANAARWTAENIFKPYGVIPFVNEEGEIAPRSVLLPDYDVSGGSVTNFPLFTSTSVTNQPAWEQTAQEIVTAINFTYEPYVVRYLTAPEWENPFHLDFMDGGAAVPISTTVAYEHDRIDQIGRYELDIHYAGIREVGLGTVYWPTSSSVLWHGWGARKFAQVQKVPIFSRFGDGAVRGTLTPLSSEVPATSGVRPGDYVRIALGTYPTLQDQSRSTDARIVQIMSIIETMGGPSYDTLDAGPAQNPLGTPTISVSTNASGSHHELVVALGSLTTESGVRWVLQTAQSSAAPSTSSELWRRVATGASSDSTGISVRALASGSTWWFRARQSAANRNASDWSTAASGETDALTAPSGLTINSSGRRADISWTYGEDNYLLRVRHAQVASSSSLTDSDIMAAIDVRGTNFTVTGLTQDSTYAAGVSHYDSYGGYSAEVSTTYQTTTDASQAPNFGTLQLITGDTG